MVDATPDTAAREPYRVLARKYRPQTFDELIGQDAMVRTLSNAFETGRIHQAYMLTGVRGVGKTTTARILARGLEYEPEEGGGKPTVTMPTLGRHCRAIMESRHLDVLEIDAASHNGVDAMRDLTDSLRYAPQLARFRVVIMDEVHMLSNAAFNALLKTLEEPPPHAKFIFATTEIRKVPITILSRCQRFDLRRVDSGLLARHLAGICDREGVTAEAEALAMIARAAEGSVRDALSLLDQAIAHAAGTVEAANVRTMLGLADRGRVIDLFEAVAKGEAAAALATLRAQYDDGADPAIILSELADFTHFVTRLKITAEAAKDPSVTEVERERGRVFADGLSIKALTRFWQMLLKGIGEVQSAPRPIAAAEMLIVRLCYAADMPSPDDLIRQLTGAGAGSDAPSRPSPGGSSPGGPSPGARASLAVMPRLAEPAPVSAAAPPQRAVPDFRAVVELAKEKRDLPLKLSLERFVRLVAFEEGRIDVALVDGAPSGLVNDLSRKLSEWTGRRWVVVLSRNEEGAPTLNDEAAARQATALTGVRADPVVRAVLERFPGAEIIGITELRPEPAVVPAPAEADDGADESAYTDDDI